MEENKDLEATNLENKVKETETEEKAVEEEKVVTEEEKKAEESGVVDLSETEKQADSLEGEYHPKETETKDILFHPIEYVDDTTHTIDEELEKVRKTYSKKISLSGIVNIVSMVVMVLGLVSVILVSFLNKDESKAWLTWLVFGIAMALIIASFVFTTILSKKGRKTNIEYLGKYHETLAGFLAKKVEIENPVFSVEATLPNEAVIQAHYFKTIMDTRSRCVLEGKRHGHDLLTGELYVLIPEIGLDKAIERPAKNYTLDGTEYKPEEETMTSTQELPSNDMTLVDHDLAEEVHGLKKEKKVKKVNPQEEKTRTGFFGRFYSYRLRIDSKESFLLCYVGKRGECVLPDYVDSFVSCHIPGLRKDIVCYLADPASSAKFFTPENVALLNDIRLDSTVQSLFLSVNSYGAKFGMNLSDDVMELPLKYPVHQGAADDFIDTSKKVFSFLDEIEKTASVLSDEEDR